MICPNCGTENADINLFCVNCGVRLRDNQVVNTPIEETPEEETSEEETSEEETSEEETPAEETQVEASAEEGTAFIGQQPGGTQFGGIQADNMQTNPQMNPQFDNAQPYNPQFNNQQPFNPQFGNGQFNNNQFSNPYNSEKPPMMHSAPSSNPAFHKAAMGGSGMGGPAMGNPAMNKQALAGAAMGNAQAGGPGTPYPMMNQGNKKNPAVLIAIIAAAVIILGGVGYYVYSGLPSTKYGKGDAAFEEGNYEEAIEYYQEAGDYEDAPEKLAESENCLHYENGKEALEAKDYDSALSELEQANGHADAKELIKKCHYEKAVILKANNDYKGAKAEFVKAEGYQDSKAQLIAMGEELTKNGQYEDAISVFDGVAEAGNNKYRYYAAGMISYNAKEYSDAADSFSNAGDVLDASDKFKECKYEYGSQMLRAGQYSTAKELFSVASGYSDADNMVNACDLMSAKSEMDAGNLNAALEALKKLPEDCSYNDVSAGGLIEKLEANKKWLDVCGIWTSTGGQMKSTENTSTYRKWWYYDFQEDDLTLDVRVTLNDDGTASVSLTGFITALTNYSEDQKDLNRKIVTIIKHETMKDLGTIKIDDNTSVTLKKGKITANYKASENSGRKHTFTTDVTYGKRKVTY